MSLLILPTQLYHPQILKPIIKEHAITQISLWECPHYFTKYNFNKKKLLLHRASMKYYYDLLQDTFSIKIEYFEYDQTPKSTQIKQYIFDPIDIIKLPKNTTKLKTPNFILTDYDEYPIKNKYIFNNFYIWAKKKSQIIPNIKSQDKYNRNQLDPRDAPKDEYVKPSRDELPYLKEAEKYVNTKFRKNIGTTDNFTFPISHRAAKAQVQLFIDKRFAKFGAYQDAVLEDKLILFHSYLSSSLNIGLLNPLEVIDTIMKTIKTKKISIPSLEGFIRQLFWREYQRFTYIRIFSKKVGNYFGNTKKLSTKWYYGTTGIHPIDQSIKKGIESGYLHHIERLMVIGNYMNLAGISPKEGYRWFMEFSIDSYQWVMGQNVLDMVFFSTGGTTSYKPYVSSSNYILKMSNYPRGEWTQEWDSLYQQFLKKHKKKLWAYRYHFPSLSKI